MSTDLTRQDLRRRIPGRRMADPQRCFAEAGYSTTASPVAGGRPRGKMACRDHLADVLDDQIAYGVVAAVNGLAGHNWRCDYRYPREAT